MPSRRRGPASWLAAGLTVASLAPQQMLLLPAVAARSLDDAPCFETCQTTLRLVRFTDPGGNDTSHPSLRPCLSRLAASSLFLCASEHCSVAERAAGLAAVNATCRDRAQAWLPPVSIIANYTDDDIARLHRLESVDDVAAGPEFSEPVLPSDTMYQLVHDTLAAWAAVSRKHLDYSIGLFIFWAAVFAIGLFYRAMARWSISSSVKRGSAWIPLDDSEDEEFGSSFKSSPSPSSRSSLPHLWLKRYITVPATFGYRSSQSFGWYTVPPRVQSLTLTAFLIMNVVFCCHGYWVFPGNMYWPDTRTQWLRYIADRTGILSFANFPLIWVFGIRNNLLLWLTGWDFGTYNNFHRWVARISTVQAIVHSVAYTIQVFDSIGWDGFVAYFDQFFWWTGEIATVLMSLLLGLSMFWFRRNTYEVFLVVHIVFSIVILYTMWGHVTIFQGRYDPPIWVCCVIWATDRVLRITRTVSFNLRFWSPAVAEATYDPAANMVRLRVPASQACYRPKPGTFYYLHVLNAGGRFWESHPFTMAKLDVAPAGSHDDDDHNNNNNDSTDRLGTSVMSDEEDRLLPSRNSKSTLQRPRESATMTFLIRPYDGFTRRLRNAAAATSSPLGPVPASLRVLVEGPYGHTQPFDKFDNLIFIVGGSGIVVPLAYLSSLLQSSTTTLTTTSSAPRRPSTASSSRSQQLHTEQQQQRHRRASTASSSSQRLSRHANSTTRAVRIIWAVREAALADSVLRDDFAATGPDGGRQLFLEDERLSVHVYVTKAQTHGDGDIFVGEQHARSAAVVEPAQSSSSSSSISSDDEAGVQGTTTTTTTKTYPENVRFLHGRPLVAAEIDDFAGEHPSGSLAVIACGPGRMADDARRTVVEMQGAGSGSGGNGSGAKGQVAKRRRRRRVDYFEESFNW
ncbi:ferric-chelate reductase [Microdochium nivale]|nr:ferric-chelate reductase [Microdochium nivale]